MKEEKKESPIGVLWGWGKPYHGKFIGSIILAVLGVACQMVPYFCVAHIVTLMLSGEQDFSSYMTACIVALCGYLGKVVFANLSTVISHTATYYTLRDLRENLHFAGNYGRFPHWAYHHDLFFHDGADGNRLLHGGGKAYPHRRSAALHPDGLLQQE